MRANLEWQLYIYLQNNFSTFPCSLIQRAEYEVSQARQSTGVTPTLVMEVSE